MYDSQFILTPLMLHKFPVELVPVVASKDGVRAWELNLLSIELLNRRITPKHLSNFVQFSVLAVDSGGEYFVLVLDLTCARVLC